MVRRGGGSQGSRVHEVCQDRQGALERDRPFRRIPPRQRHLGGHQQQRPVSQAPRPGLPQHRQLHQHDPPPLREAQIRLPTVFRIEPNFSYRNRKISYPIILSSNR